MARLAINARISDNTPGHLQQRHSVPNDLMQNLAVVEALAAKAGE